MKEKGYITLNRGFFDNPLWKEERVYSRAEAWLDLIQSARFEANKEIINNKLIEVQRGQLIASRRYLQKRWCWGGTKVSNFLNLLVKEGMINQQTNQGQTTLTLCKYKDYNKPIRKGKPPNEPSANHRQTTDKPNINKGNKEKEFNKGVVLSVLDFWNANCGGLPKITSIANARRSALSARIAEHGIIAVQQAIVKAGESKFLSGENDRGFKATFDWIMRPNNFPKVLEGNYENKLSDNMRYTRYGLLSGQ